MVGRKFNILLTRGLPSVLDCRPVARGGVKWVMTAPNEICPRKNTVVGHTFSKKNRLRRAKIDWILQPIPEKFRLRRPEDLGIVHILRKPRGGEGVSKCLRLLTGRGSRPCLRKQKITILDVEKNKIRVKTDEHH